MVSTMVSSWQQELDKLADSFFDPAMQDRVAGAAVAVVKDGQTYLRGSGYADRENRRIVIPETTVFRAGSLSELFTTIAVLQLVEQGRLQLSDNVNKYLSGFQIPGKATVTVANLLSHTDGFEERTRSVVVSRLAEKRPLGEILAADLKAPVTPPGQAVTLNSWGMAVAGYIVEQLTEQTFFQYAEEHILKPLEMHDSSFESFLPDGFKERLAIVYTNDGGAFFPVPFVYATTPATDGLFTTAADMTHLITALLQGGRYGDTRILQEATVRDMFRQRFTRYPQLPGVTDGFVEYEAYGQHGLIADGRNLGVRSRLFLMPEHNTGLFIICNNDSDVACDGFTTAFVRHFYAASARKPAPMENFKARADRFVGFYRWLQYDRHSLGKLHSLLNGTLQVSNNENGTLAMKSLSFNGVMAGVDHSAEITPIEGSTLFERLDNGTRVVFQENENGLITSLHSGDSLRGSYKKLAWYETPTFQFGLFGLCAIMFVSGVFIWGIGALLASPSDGGTTPWVAALLAGFISLLDVIFIGGAVTFITRRVGGLSIVNFRTQIPRWVRLTFVIPLLNSLLALALLLCAMLAVQYSWYSTLGRLHFLLLTVCAFAFLGLLSYWNLFRLQNLE